MILPNLKYALISASSFLIGVSAWILWETQHIYPLPELKTSVRAFRGQALFALDGKTRHGYLIREVEPIGSGIHMNTKCDNKGFEARAAQRWSYLSQ